MSSTIDALVVGAGPTGLMMAGELARRGLPVRIIDKAKTLSLDRSRALAVQSRTLEILEAVGLADAELAHGRLIAGINLLGPHGKRSRLPLRVGGELSTRYPGTFTVQQSDTEAVLASRLPGLGVMIERGVELVSYTQDTSGISASLRLEGGELEQVGAKWLLGCDGAHSIVRKGAGIPFEGEMYGEDFLVSDMLIDWALPDGEFYIAPSPGGAAAVFSLPEPRRFRVVLTMRDAPRGRSDEPSLEEFVEGMRARLPLPFKVEKSFMLTRYRLHHRVAARHRDRRAFLCGDAAHIHSPVGGQGMNTGIQDAYNLAWKIAAVEQGRMPSWVLDTYEAERLPVAHRLVDFTDRFFGLVAGGGAANRALRAIVPHILPRAFKLKAVRSRAAAFLSQLGIRYRKSPLSTQIGAPPQVGPLPGDRAPDGALAGADGQPVRLFDLLRGVGFTLLIFAGVRATEATQARAARLAARFGSSEVKFITLGAKGPGAYEDPGCMTHVLYGVTEPAAVLVRPDGYIALRADTLDEAALERELGRLFTSTAATAIAAE